MKKKNDKGDSPMLLITLYCIFDKEPEKFLSFVQTCIKYSSRRQSAQGSETSMGRTSFEMSQHLIRIFLS